MQDVKIGIVGLGNVGGGTLAILSENAEELSRKLGFRLRVAAVSSLDAKSLKLPAACDGALITENWREVAENPDVQIVAELVGGTKVAREIVETAIANGKHVVTANKELIALEGAAIWKKAAARGLTLAMEASVCGGIPIHGVMREGIAGDQVETLFGILNGTSNYILTEIEKRGANFAEVLKEAQELGYAEADPTADVDGYDARSKLTLLASLAFGVRFLPSEIHTEGIRRVSPIDFEYAHQLGSTIKLLCSARRADGGVFASVRPALVPRATILASVQGAYNAVWSRGKFGADTFYYGRGAGPLPTGVAVVSDLMRVAREIATCQGERVSPFAFTELTESKPLPIEQQKRAWYLRFRITDRPGIIRDLSAILARHSISIDAVLQLPHRDKKDLPFVITLETTPEVAVRQAIAEMNALDFMVEPLLAMPMEAGL